ncbi:MAG: hypothetical protein M0019_08920 [Actinomycetota bacterium]|nr:hypothetical protein [Actinomycetota bacterium]
MIVSTLTMTNLALLVGPTIIYAATTWPGTLILGHNIAPLPMSIPNSLPGLNLVTQEMLVAIFTMLTSILICLFLSHAFASSKAIHCTVSESINYAMVPLSLIAVVSSIPISSLGDAIVGNETSILSIGRIATINKCLQGTKLMLELSPNGNSLAIEAMTLTGHSFAITGASIGYDVAYPQSLMDSILSFSSHSGVAYLPIFEHELNSSKIDSVITSTPSHAPWSNYASEIGSRFHVTCSSNQKAISRI